ncbi:MAG: hypothetical protein U0W40_03715 [Acidimicrobiia bacterium]
MAQARVVDVALAPKAASAQPQRKADEVVGADEPSTAAGALERDGWVVLGGQASSHDATVERARAVIEVVDDPLSGLGSLGLIADYALPPPGAKDRAFQVLHFDFGLPLGTVPATDVARYTALWVSSDCPVASAATRLVRLAGLGRRRRWPPSDQVIARLVERRSEQEPSEGILARIVEAADRTTELPDKEHPEFLCGLEFDSLSAERRFFARHHLDLHSSEQLVALSPGEILIFDNLACAHGRMGSRRTHELRQVCFGFAGLGAEPQRRVLSHSLEALVSADADGL